MVPSVVTGATAGGHLLSTQTCAMPLTSCVFEGKKREEQFPSVTSYARHISFPHAISPCLASSAFVETREENEIAACNKSHQLRSYWANSKDVCSGEFVRQQASEVSPFHCYLKKCCRACLNEHITLKSIHHFF